MQNTELSVEWRAMHQSADVLRETESNPLIIIFSLIMTKNLDYRQNKNHI